MPSLNILFQPAVSSPMNDFNMLGFIVQVCTQLPHGHYGLQYSRHMHSEKWRQTLFVFSAHKSTSEITRRASKSCQIPETIDLPTSSCLLRLCQVTRAFSAPPSEIFRLDPTSCWAGAFSKLSSEPKPRSMHTNAAVQSPSLQTGNEWYPKVPPESLLWHVVCPKPVACAWTKPLVDD